MSLKPEASADLDPRVRRTRQLILEAFHALLEEKGFKALSVQDLAARSGINRATFYAHFADKYALLDHAVRTAFGAEIVKRGLDTHTDGPENVRSLILIVCEFLLALERRCAGPHPEFDALVEGALRQEIHALLMGWLAVRRPSAELPATVATWAIYGLATHYSHLKRRPALETFVAEAYPLVAAGLLPAR